MFKRLTSIIVIITFISTLGPLPPAWALRKQASGEDNGTARAIGNALGGTKTPYTRTEAQRIAEYYGHELGTPGYERAVAGLMAAPRTPAYDGILRTPELPPKGRTVAPASAIGAPAPNAAQPGETAMGAPVASASVTGAAAGELAARDLVAYMFSGINKKARMMLATEVLRIAAEYDNVSPQALKQFVKEFSGRTFPSEYSKEQYKKDSQLLIVYLSLPAFATIVTGVMFGLPGLVAGIPGAIIVVTIFLPIVSSQRSKQRQSYSERLKLEIRPNTTFERELRKYIVSKGGTLKVTTETEAPAVGSKGEARATGAASEASAKGIVWLSPEDAIKRVQELLGVHKDVFTVSAYNPTAEAQKIGKAKTAKTKRWTVMYQDVPKDTPRGEELKVKTVSNLKPEVLRGFTKRILGSPVEWTIFKGPDPTPGNTAKDPVLILVPRHRVVARLVKRPLDVASSYFRNPKYEMVTIEASASGAIGNALGVTAASAATATNVSDRTWKRFLSRLEVISEFYPEAVGVALEEDGKRAVYRGRREREGTAVDASADTVSPSITHIMKEVDVDEIVFEPQLTWEHYPYHARVLRVLARLRERVRELRKMGVYPARKEWHGIEVELATPIRGKITTDSLRLSLGDRLRDAASAIGAPSTAAATGAKTAIKNTSTPREFVLALKYRLAQRQNVGIVLRGPTAKVHRVKVLRGKVTKVTNVPLLGCFVDIYVSAREPSHKLFVNRLTVEFVGGVDEADQHAARATGSVAAAGGETTNGETVETVSRKGAIGMMVAGILGLGAGVAGERARVTNQALEPPYEPTLITVDATAAFPKDDTFAKFQAAEFVRAQTDISSRHTTISGKTRKDQASAMFFIEVPEIIDGEDNLPRWAHWRKALFGLGRFVGLPTTRTADPQIIIRALKVNTTPENIANLSIVGADGLLQEAVIEKGNIIDENAGVLIDLDTNGPRTFYHESSRTYMIPCLVKTPGPGESFKFVVESKVEVRNPDVQNSTPRTQSTLGPRGEEFRRALRDIAAGKGAEVTEGMATGAANALGITQKQITEAIIKGSAARDKLLRGNRKRQALDEAIARLQSISGRTITPEIAQQTRELIGTINRLVKVAAMTPPPIKPALGSRAKSTGAAAAAGEGRLEVKSLEETPVGQWQGIIGRSIEDAVKELQYLQQNPGKLRRVLFGDDQMVIRFYFTPLTEETLRAFLREAIEDTRDFLTRTGSRRVVDENSVIFRREEITGEGITLIVSGRSGAVAAGAAGRASASGYTADDEEVRQSARQKLQAAISKHVGVMAWNAMTPDDRAEICSGISRVTGEQFGLSETEQERLAEYLRLSVGEYEVGAAAAGHLTAEQIIVLKGVASQTIADFGNVPSHTLSRVLEKTRTDFPQAAAFINAVETLRNDAWVNIPHEIRSYAERVIKENNLSAIETDFLRDVLNISGAAAVGGGTLEEVFAGLWQAGEAGINAPRDAITEVRIRRLTGVEHCYQYTQDEVHGDLVANPILYLLDNVLPDHGIDPANTRRHGIPAIAKYATTADDVDKAVEMAIRLAEDGIDPGLALDKGMRVKAIVTRGTIQKPPIPFDTYISRLEALARMMHSERYDWLDFYPKQLSEALAYERVSRLVCHEEPPSGVNVDGGASIDLTRFRPFIEAIPAAGAAAAGDM